MRQKARCDGVSLGSEGQTRASYRYYRGSNIVPVRKPPNNQFFLSKNHADHGNLRFRCMENGSRQVAMASAKDFDTWSESDVDEEAGTSLVVSSHLR